MEVLLSEVASFDRGFAAQHKPQSLRMLNATLRAIWETACTEMPYRRKR